MTENLPATRPTAEVATADTDSWIQVVGNVAALAERIAETEFVPRNLRNKVPAVAAAILYGREVGLPPMTALTQTHVIEGRPSMSAEAMRALVVAAGHEFVTEETTGALCTMRARRRGSETWTTITWTIDMARAAGLLGKDNWKHYPRQMLQARCTAELVRLVFPDVVHGFRAIEELDDDGEAEDTSAAAALAPASTTVRRGRATKKSAAKKAAGLPPAAPAARPAPEGPPLPGEDGYDALGGAGEASAAGGEAEDPPAAEQAPERVEEPSESVPTAEPEHTDTSVSVPADPYDGVVVDAEVVGEQTDEQQTEERRPPRPVSRAQQRMLFAQWGDLGLSDDQPSAREERLLITSKIIGRAVESSNDLNADEAKALIDTLGRCKSLADVHAVLDAIDAHAARGEQHG